MTTTIVAARVGAVRTAAGTPIRAVTPKLPGVAGTSAVARGRAVVTLTTTIVALRHAVAVKAAAAGLAIRKVTRRHHAAVGMTMMDQEERATTPKGLWMLVVAGPAIVAIEMEANFVLVRQACSAQRNVALYAVVMMAMLLTIATGFAALSIWRRTGVEWPTEAVDLANRVRFITALGVLSSVMSLLVILAQAFATLLFDPCQG